MPWTKKQLERIEKETIESLCTTTNYNDWFYEDDGYGGINIVSPSFQALARQHGFKDIWVAGPGGLFVGYWCGKDDDLICVLPLKYKETIDLDPYLSPVGKTPQEGLKLAINKRKKCCKRGIKK